MAKVLAAQMANLQLGHRQAPVIRHFEGLRAGAAAKPVRAQVLPQHQVVQRRTPLHIQAARVAGVEIPNQKRIEYALQYIYGVGPTTARAILVDTSVENKRTRELTEEELTRLRDEVEKYTVEGDLRRTVALNIRRLKEISCYRGRRHINNLPCRGQRTKTNARTRKGKAKTVANKKK